MQEDRSTIQRDLDWLESWAATSRMKVNADEGRVLHIRKNNQEFKYQMGDNRLDNSTVEKDIGVLVDLRLIRNLQCNAMQQQMQFWAASQQQH